MSSASLDMGQSFLNDSVDIDWAALVELPFDEWNHMQHNPALNVWAERASKMTWSVDDEHFSQPRYTTALMQLLRLISRGFCHDLERLHREKEELGRSLSAAQDAEEAIRARVELLRRENDNLRILVEKNEGVIEGETKGIASHAILDSGVEKRRYKEKLDQCAREVDRLKRENNELHQTVQRCNAEKRHILGEDEKFRLEYEHLAAKHKRLIEKYKKADDMLREIQRSERNKGQHDEGELHRLRQKLRTLQQDNYNLIQSRDRAEELCEVREAEALKDMAELQQLHRDIVEEEKQRSQSLAMELQKVQDDVNRRIEKAVQGLQQVVKGLEEENSTLRKRLKQGLKAGGYFEDEMARTSETGEQYSSSVTTSLSSFFLNDTPRSRIEANNRMKEKLITDRQRLQEENDRLAVELQQMEVRAESRDAEMIKIQHLVKEYERGDEGLQRLRDELINSNRSIDLLQDENAQLRERLNAMEDSLTFSAALQELCIRIGVTREEIDRLRPKNTSLFSEVETLREEVATLKDEVEWLEKERRHWMDKVRLQPLLDTKLRFELGLSSEQLKQLDHMVDQMKAGRLIVEEDGDENYKEKYFHELQLRRKEMEHFNDFVRHRIEEALREALGEKYLNSASDAASVVSTLRERFDFIATRPLMDSTQESPLNADQLRMQLQSVVQLLKQSELTIKDNTASQAMLREQLAAVTAERDMLINERDKYRTVVFEVLRVPPSSSSFPPLPPPPPLKGEGNELIDEKIPSSPLPESGAADGEAHAVPREMANCSILSSQSLPVVAHRNNAAVLDSVPFSSISRTFEEQLRLKDELISSLKTTIEATKEDIAHHHAEKIKKTEKLSEALAVQEDLRNQVSATQQMNEELSGKLEEQKKTLEDLHEVIQRVESGNTRELLQKIVVLRQREGKLLERLRRAREAQEESSRSEQTMREYVNTTFKSLKEALENTSTGFVLPRSSGNSSSNSGGGNMFIEKDVLEDVQQRLEGVLRGKLFKEDLSYLVQLRQVYRNMENVEELYSLRNDVKCRQKQVEELESEIQGLRIELEQLHKVQNGRTSSINGDGASSQAARWEIESTTWRQKCDLYMRRYENKEREVSTLEAELSEAREELALLQEYLHHNHCDTRKDNKEGTLTVLGDDTTTQETQQQQQQQHEEGEGGSGGKSQPQEQVEHPNQQGKQVSHAISVDKKVRQLQHDIARLKSINLGLLHHSLDFQGEYKRLEIQLEAAKQELSLVRDTGDSRKVSDFVSAAIQQHAALRRQSELALLRAKRTRMQLSATEANLRVAVNEATSYRLSAFRLYRAYVSQMVSVLDYVRSLHRDTKGAMSPHRVEMMHQRFLKVVTDMEHNHTQHSEMCVKLTESSGMVNLLQQQLELLNMKDSEEREDAIHAKLFTSLSSLREKDVRLIELQEDHQYMQQKLKRAESHINQLTEELTRLELRSTGAVSLNEDILQRLLQLKESVFAKVESPALVMQSNGRGSRDVDDVETDAAIREYKTALGKQAELARECTSLKKRLDMEVAEAHKFRAETETLKEEMNRLKDRLQYTQRQLEEERKKGEEREQRIVRSHVAQAEVTRRAAEHNSHCLREMLQNKEACIEQLQMQLQMERRKYIEYQLEESSRMEKLHDHLFKENNAMMERFREAIDGVTENYTYNTVTSQGIAANDSSSPDGGVSAQLALLTRETLRLKAELKDARATNIMLEAQLNDQVTKAQKQLLQQELSRQPQQNRGAEQTPLVPLPGEASVVGVINDQNVIIENLRQREFTLTRDMQRYKNERDVMEQQLHEVRQFVVEQGGVLKTVAAVGMGGGSPVEQELRAQLSFVESQLSEARMQLEEERQNARRLQSDTSEWRSHLDNLREEVVRQQADVERARHLVSMNESLNADIRRMEEQNEKLIMATNMLKQKLIEQAQQRGDDCRKHQHELTLAQRMGFIQMESTDQLKTLNERLHSIQRELKEKVHREEEALKKQEETQRMAYDLHRRLQEREQEILRLKRELAARPTSSQGVKGGRERGTQVLHTVQEGNHILSENMGTDSRESPQVKNVGVGVENKEEEEGEEKKRKKQYEGKTQMQHTSHRSHSSSPATAPIRRLLADVDANILAKPQIAALLRREIEKAQRDNMHEISCLRADVRRLQSDLEETQQQLRGERENSRSLRAMMQDAQRRVEEKELAMERESVIRQRRAKYCQNTTEKGSMPGGTNLSVANPVVVVSPVPGTTTAPNEHDNLRRQKEENDQLRRQIERLKKRVVAFDDLVSEAESYKKELDDLRKRQLDSVDAAHMASPLDIRSHKRNVLHLESVIESLQRELNVNKEIQVRSLQRRIDELTAELNSHYQNPQTTLPLGTAPLRNENGSGRVAALERDLLEKNNLILDLRFEREALQLKVGQLERHIEEIMKVDSTNTKHTGAFQQRSRVEALESVVENLKLVVERLQQENNTLKTKTVSMSKYMDLVRELRGLRQNERRLREHSEMLTKRLFGSTPSGSAMSKQQAALQRRLQTAKATMEQYKAEVFELKQKLEDQQQTTENEDSTVSGKRYREEEEENRRSVHPLDTWSSDIPPPLPGPPVRLTSESASSHTVYPHIVDDSANVP